MNMAMAAVLATVLTAVAPAAQAALLTYSIVGALNGQRLGDLGDAADALPLHAGTPITFTLTVDDNAVAARVQPFGTSYHAAVSDLAIGAMAVDGRAGCAAHSVLRNQACTITLEDAANADSVTLHGPIGALAELPGAPRNAPQFVQLRAHFVDPTGTLLDGEQDHMALQALPVAQFRGQLALLWGGGFASSLVGFDVTSIVNVNDDAAVAVAVATPGAAALVSLALLNAAAVCVRRRRGGPAAPTRVRLAAR